MADERGREGKRREVVEGRFKWRDTKEAREIYLPDFG